MMRLSTVQSVLAAGLALAVGLTSNRSWAASPAIGTINGQGAFRVENATVRGHATLFEAATIETATATTDLTFQSGARMTLGTDTKGRVFGDHLVLERGQGSLENPAGFRVEARGLVIQPETGTARGRVVLTGINTVQVAASSGSFRVLNARGVLLAKLAPGLALAFEPQAAGGLTKLTGCLESKAGHYLLTDEATRVTVEVRASDAAKLDLTKHVGKRNEVSGTADPAATPASDASQLVRVISVKPLSGGATACAGGVAAGTGGAAAAGAGGATAGAATGSWISGTVIAVIGGGVAAGTLGGLAASGSIGGSGSPAVSR